MRMRTMCLAIMLALPTLPTPALAQSCFDLWVARNAIYDNNGYCFKSRLGRTYFDNSDCYTNNARLSKAEHRRVARIKDQERRRGCRIRTNVSFYNSPYY